ncbi:MAG TPA: hypothetical protein VJI68_02455 [Candidatus Nanoarchaeia archaeon]|nr:hypothetical protein [Candidatus Nanoarchaeia archaeon]
MKGWVSSEANGKIISWINQRDLEIMTQTYLVSPRIEGLTPNDFLSTISWRIYTEHFSQPGSCYWANPRLYDGKPFREWVNDETHYELVRKQFSWDKTRNQFEGNGDVTKAYQEIRPRILQAVVKRAIELFREWGGPQPIDKEDKRNLRTSLEKYIN